MAAEDKSGEPKTAIEFELLEWLAWVGRDVGIETTSLIPILYIQTLLLVTKNICRKLLEMHLPSRNATSELSIGLGA